MPQVGQPDPASPPRADEGSVRRADDHFERFARFIDGCLEEAADVIAEGKSRDDGHLYPGACFEVFFCVDGTATYTEEVHRASLLNLSHGFSIPALCEELH